MAELRERPATRQAPPGEPQWRPYRPDDRATLVIDKRDTVVDDLDRALREAWGDDVLSFR